MAEIFQKINMAYPLTKEVSPVPQNDHVGITHGRGVILVCFIGEIRDRVVCVVEGNTKAWKKRGQKGVVFETVESSESHEQAVKRALVEELTLDPRCIDRLEPSGEIVLHAYHEARKQTIFTAQVYLVQLKTGTQIATAVPDSEEILSRDIVPITSLNGSSRPGTVEAIELVLDAKKTGRRVIHVRDGITLEE